MPVILLAAFLFLLLLWSFYQIIRNAINHSELARDIKSIKTILIAELAQTDFVDNDTEPLINLCPNCGEKLKSKAKQCPRCQAFIRSN